MAFADQQYRAHIERQRRLGKIPPKPLAEHPAFGPLPARPGGMSPATPETKTIKALQREVADLTARLQAVLREDQSPLVAPSRIKPVITAVAKYYGLPLRDLVSFRRNRSVVRARQVAMYLAKMLTKHSLSTIGRVFERNHTTILYAVGRVEMLRQQEPLLDTQIRDLTGQLTPPTAT